MDESDVRIDLEYVDEGDRIDWMEYENPNLSDPLVTMDDPVHRAQSCEH